jgi:diguanylate cyclase (GGDEF)-like protein/PAS domain S-box-containing protein
LLSALGGIIAVVTAFAFPAGYAVIGHLKQADQLARKAELTAARVASHIQAPITRHSDPDQLAAISELLTASAVPLVQRIVDPHGATVLEKGTPLPWPTFTREGPILASGALIGRLEISASIRPLIEEVAVVALGALALAAAAYFASAVPPLRFIDETLAKLETANDKLEQQKKLLDTALDNMVQGLVMFDAEERVVIANDRFQEVYGLEPGELKPGETLREVAASRVASGVYRGITADDVVKAVRGRVARGTVSHVTSRLGDGRIVSVAIHPRQGGGWVSTHTDITEREKLNARLEEQNRLLKAQEEMLRAQNQQLDAALNNMVQGLAMFDADGRVVIANAPYAELYGLTPEQVKPGTPLREIVEHRIANGLYAGEDVERVEQELIERARIGKVSHLANKLADGRMISASVRPRSDGGWVVTHQDISEREALGAQLARQNALLEQREQQLQAQNARFVAAIDNMSQGLCLFDREQRVVFANRRYAELYGLSPGEVQPGTTLREILTARAARGVYDNTDAAQSIEEGVASFNREVSQILPLADGRFISVLRRPMPDGSLISTHEDITEREKLYAELAAQKEELRAQNERFDAALRNMSQGLCMFDAEQRVLMANERYAEIYGLTLDQVTPGTTLRQIIEHRIAKGIFAGANPEAYIQERLARFHEASVAVHRLSDGRSICIRRQPMAEGGWVTTHEDVTEREALQIRLEQQNQQLDAAMNNMSQGLAMFDDQQRLVVCNKLYAEMYGLSPEQVKPGTTAREILQHRLSTGCYATDEPDRFADDRLAKYGTIDSEVMELADGRIINVSQRQMANGWRVFTHQDITAQRCSEAKIVHMALHDALTDLPNRVLLNERLEQALPRIRRDEMLAVHLIDLDHFKSVNDTLGHAAGDKLLKLVTGRLRGLVREVDTIARMGGDEFAVLQVGIGQPSDATALALRIIEAIGAPYDIDDQQVIIGTSIGIAVGPSDGDKPDQLIRSADLALYRAKEDGRGTYRYFGPEMDAQMQARRIMECDLRRALAAGEFELHYQPVVDLSSDEISGVEALIRWHHPEKGTILPSAFIPVAEEIGFIVPLGEWAIREACRTASRWPGNVRIAVNLSPVQFRNPGFVQVVVNALATSGLAADRLELEITETVLLHDSEATLSTLYQLRALGVRIAIDDFGTGFSSLSYLQSFPFDKIKIDRSFVNDIADGVGSLNIVRAVAAMANGLGMRTTAEGVETVEQLETVRAEGCTEMQGFLFSRPLPAGEIEQLLLARCKPTADDGKRAEGYAA